MISLIFLIAGFAGVIVSAISTFKNKISYFKGVCLGTLSQLVSFILSVANIIIVYGENPIDSTINGMFSGLKEIISTMPVDSFASIFGDAPVIDALSLIEALREAYTILFPAMIIISYCATTLFLFIIIRWFLQLIKRDVSFIPQFNEISLTKPVLIGGIFSVVMGYVLSGTVIGNVFSNIQLLFIMYLALCGWSLIDYAVAKKIKIGFIRFIIYFVLILLFGSIFGIVIYFGALIAIIDVFKNFRKRTKGI